MDQKRLQKLQDIQDWQANKPSKNEDWAKDVKAESLHVKFDYQLEEMEVSHQAKIPKVEKELDKFTNWPDVVRYELTERFTQMFSEQDNPATIEGKTLQEWIDQEFEEQHLYYQWKKAKLEQSVERIQKERELRTSGFVIPDKDNDKNPVDTKSVQKDRIRTIHGTTYYIDADNGNDGADGLTPTGDATNGPWATLDQFTENARSAGDIVKIRRGTTARIDNGTDLLFTSDGDLINPIVIEADYDDDWSDEVNLSSTATATLTFGSKTVTFSADVSSVLAAGDWIYASGDSNRVFAYEVASVVTTTVTLYLPYKGDQAGSGKTMFNMQSAPVWNTAAGDFQWNFDGDDLWKVQGLQIAGTDSNGNVEMDGSTRHMFIHCIFIGNGSADSGIEVTDENSLIYVKSCRFYNEAIGVTGSSDSCVTALLFDCLMDGNSVTNAQFINTPVLAASRSEVTVVDCESINLTRDIFLSGGEQGRFLVRNLISGASTAIAQLSTFDTGFEVLIEDYDNNIGDNRYLSGLFNLNVSDAYLYQSETTKIRSGGSAKSIQVNPVSGISSVWDITHLKLFELPIYLTAESHTITVYFASDDNTDWDANPTASQLWIECEYWGHATNNYRRITKSTGTVDFQTDTDFDQSLAVTVTPAQAGVAYIRCYYAKPLESGNSNIFYVDPLPVIT